MNPVALGGLQAAAAFHLGGLPQEAEEPVGQVAAEHKEFLFVLLQIVGQSCRSVVVAVVGEEEGEQQILVGHPFGAVRGLSEDVIDASGRQCAVVLLEFVPDGFVTLYLPFQLPLDDVEAEGGDDDGEVERGEEIGDFLPELDAGLVLFDKIHEVVEVSACHVVVLRQQGESVVASVLHRREHVVAYFYLGVFLLELLYDKLLERNFFSRSVLFVHDGVIANDGNDCSSFVHHVADDDLSDFFLRIVEVHVFF